MRKNILQAAIESYQNNGYCLWQCVDGIPSTSHNSKCFKAVEQCKKELQGRYKSFDVVVVVGGRRWYKTEGNHMAIMFKVLEGGV